jgi:uncharacterized protein (TIGR02300 family)
LGKKRRCLECDAPFYDLNRDPIACPKCGAPYQPVARLKSDGREPPKGRTFTRRKPEPAEAAAEPAAEAPELLEDDLDPAEEEEADEPDEDDRLDGDSEPEPGETGDDEKR